MKLLIAALALTAVFGTNAFAARANEPAPAPYPICQHDGPANPACNNGSPGQISGAGNGGR